MQRIPIHNLIIDNITVTEAQFNTTEYGTSCIT